MIWKIYNAKLLLIIFLFLSVTITFGQNAKDIVNGNLIQFNDNGLWCWFQDERAVVDTVNGKLIVGSSACQNGFGGSTRAGADDAVIYDLQTGIPIRYQLAKSPVLSTDDHNAPGMLIRPDGKYIAMYSDHYDKYKNRYRIFDGTSWSPERAYDWTTRPGGTNYTIAYNNLYYLSAEGRMYDFSRANQRSPNFIISDDMGDTWTFGGQLTTNSSSSYNKGYYKYWGNGVDRIDFIFTEQHPRDTLTSIYHGYIKGGKAYKSDDTVVDEDIRDITYIPAYWNFTKIFSNGTVIGNNTFYRCWTSDLVRYNDGTIAAIITARMNQSTSPGYPDTGVNPEHAFIYCRYYGHSWSSSFLNKAGFKFYSSEADYVGLGALDPNDPNTLYISSPYDPRDTTTNLVVREIFKGTTLDNGVTWSWTPITQNSTRDNIRPIIPAWDKDHTALLWCRGTYITAQSFDAAVVGIIENKNETVSLMNYVDASTLNTTLADGTALVTTGPDANAGAGDNNWHQRTGFGNGNNVFTSSEVSGENAPALKTTVTVPASGAYDIWVNFWAEPTADWRIKAGFNLNPMQIFRQMTCKQVANGDQSTSIILSGDQNTFLYQAYVGRVQISGYKNIDIYIDDEAIRTGSTTLTGNTVRTWYDGVSYSSINGGMVDVAARQNIPANFRLEQNYPNPFNPSTVISYQLSSFSFVTLKVYDMLGREVSTLVNEFQPAGSYSSQFSIHNLNSGRQGSQLSSGVYFYTLRANDYIHTKKMVLMK